MFHQHILQVFFCQLDGYLFEGDRLNYEALAALRSIKEAGTKVLLIDDDGSSKLKGVGLNDEFGLVTDHQDPLKFEFKGKELDYHDTELSDLPTRIETFVNKMEEYFSSVITMALWKDSGLDFLEFSDLLIVDRKNLVFDLDKGVYTCNERGPKAIVEWASELARRVKIILSREEMKLIERIRNEEQQT